MNRFLPLMFDTTNSIVNNKYVSRKVIEGLFKCLLHFLRKNQDHVLHFAVKN